MNYSPSVQLNFDAETRVIFSITGQIWFVLSRYILTNLWTTDVPILKKKEYHETLDRRQNCLFDNFTSIIHCSMKYERVFEQILLLFRIDENIIAYEGITDLFGCDHATLRQEQGFNKCFIFLSIQQKVETCFSWSRDNRQHFSTRSTRIYAAIQK